LGHRAGVRWPPMVDRDELRASSPGPPHRRRRHSSRWTSPTPTTPPNPRPRPRPDPGASPGQSSSPASSPSTSPAAENVAAACVSSRSSPTPTPSPESSTAPALPLRLLLLARSCCSPDRAPLRRRVHPPAPRCRPHCPSRAPDRALRHARASPCAQDRAKISRPRPPRRSPGRFVLHPRPQIPTSKLLSALTEPAERQLLTARRRGRSSAISRLSARSLYTWT
jgi:hypothetical protein